jgi:hypothetical protein
LNGAYASNLDDLILDNPQIKLWCFGHSHSSVDKMIGETRMLSNPKGYKDQNQNFDPNMIIEI